MNRSVLMALVHSQGIASVMGGASVMGIVSVMGIASVIVIASVMGITNVMGVALCYDKLEGVLILRICSGLSSWYVI